MDGFAPVVLQEKLSGIHFCDAPGSLQLTSARYTAGVVGGLSVCAPFDRLLNFGGPLAVGLGVVLCILR